MDFNFDEEDDSSSTNSFFERLHGEGTSKNLSQVFEEDSRAFRHESPSLRYQPRSRKEKRGEAPPTFASFLSSFSSEEESNSTNSSPRPAGPGRWEVLFARVVNVYQGVETGPMGLAVSMRATNDEANMMVYKKKSQIITTVRLLPNGHRVHYRDTYIQFYDRSRAFWSLRFMYEKDESMFVRMMLDNSLPLEVHSAGSTGSVEQQEKALEGYCRKQEENGQPDDNDNDPSWDNSCMNIVNRREQPPSDDGYSVDSRPQPKPRLRSSAASSEEHSQESDADSKSRSQAHISLRDRFKQNGDLSPRSPAFMAALREHFGLEARPKPEPVPEDVLVTRLPRPIGTTDPAPPRSSSPPRMSLTDSVRASVTRFSSIIRNRINLDEPATSPPSSPPLSPRSSETLLDQNLDGEAIMEVLRKRSTHVATQHTPATQEATTTMDPEDRFIELEQQVLDLKKENRALTKTLQQRDDEFQVFQKSSAKLMDLAIQENQDLKQRNNMFLETITEQIGRGKFSSMNLNNNQQPSSGAEGSSCQNCEHAAEEIKFLKEHIAAMKQAMRDAEL